MPAGIFDRMSMPDPAAPSDATGNAGWRHSVADFQRASAARAIWQIVSTLIPYGLVWCAMYYSLAVSWWITAPLAVLSGALLVRVFIIFHDCGHGSYFRSRAANEAVGFAAGVLTLTPYYHWRWEHSIHHGSASHLDKRGIGDVWTMTVQEYLEASRWKRFAYRLARNPVVLFVLAPMLVFVVIQRFPVPKAARRERESVWWTNLGIILLAVAFCQVFSPLDYLIIKIIETAVGGGVGIWLFYVQHQFEGAYWEREDRWDYTAAALQGSSFYKLPRVLQWFTGNIGFHHIRHLSARIPNYHLQKCHEAVAMFKQVRPLTLRSSLKSAALHLWDEQARMLVGFGYLRQFQNVRATNAGARPS
jgi:acyl-lipid omega-6 desaturase (Delta-12 desaturase)